MDPISLGLSIFALVLSAYSMYYSIITRNDSARAQSIDDAYSIFHEMDQLHIQNWQLSHLFVSPGEYHEVSEQVAQQRNLIDENRIEYLLKEKAIAYFIFDLFERTLYQLNQAKAARDHGRAKFLQEVIDFLCSQTLRNPRLLYYWSKCSDNYQKTTTQYYRTHVTENPSLPILHPSDSLGPFHLQVKSE